ncbi:hypothetical protein C6503_21835 [Candidatus Poribacteria bacterium]|nr:MAG: hypothetical protein C6503_21835 [Candidatus Poribacteria bacterium]
MNISENKKLVPSIAEQLILELFAGQTKELQEIKTKVEEVHKQRGGLPHSAKIHPVEKALNNLKKDEKAEKPPLVYWKIDATTENTIKTLDEFIEWSKQFEEGEYVFRGVPNKAYKIQASAYRRPEESDRNFVNFLHTNRDLIRTARQRGYDHKDGSEWNELDILVELQHFRAATCLIDFSFSAQVALWFACQQERKKEKNGGLVNSDKPPHGKVSAVKIKQRKYTEITPDFMKGEDEKRENEKRIDFFLNDDADPQLYYLQPKFQNNRIIAQQSVLLFGNYEIDADKECFIEGGCKDEILTELERTSGYTEDRLFPDFEGFAWVNRQTAPYTAKTFQAYKDLGQYAYENDDYDNALEDLSRAIDFETDDAEVYYLRGLVYVSKEENENAFKDFDKAIALKFDSAELYYNRGYLYQQQGLYSDAINDYDTAIDKKEDYGEAYYRRGQSRYHLDRVEEALEDFAEAISLRPDYFDVYFQRGLVLRELQEYPSALDDFSRAIEINPNDISVFINRSETLFYLQHVDDARQDLLVALDLAIQQKDDEMVAKINILFQDVFGHNTSEEEDE